MSEKEFLTAPEEKSCELCFKVAMLYNRRERLISEGQEKLAVRLDIHIKQTLIDLKDWMMKNDT
jgi:hypothetical protein